MRVLFVAFVIFAIAVAKEEDTSKFPKVEKIIKDLSPEQRSTLRELTQDQKLIDQVKELNIEEMGALVEKLKVKSSQAKVSPKVKKILDQLTDEQKTALQEIVSDEELFGKIMNLNKDEQKSFVGEIKKESSDVKGSAEKKDDKSVKKEKTEKEVKKKKPEEDKEEKEKEKKKESGTKERKVVEKEVKKSAEDDEKKTVKKEVKKSAEDDEKKTVKKEVKKSAEDDDDEKTVKKEVKKSAKKEEKNFEEFSKSLSEEQRSTLNDILQDETKSETLVGLKKKDMDKLKTAIESSIEAKGSATTQQQNLSPEAQRIISELTPEQRKVVGRVIADEEFFGRIMSLNPTELQGLFQAVRSGTEPQNPEIKRILNEFTPTQRQVLHELFQNMAVVNRIKNLQPADLHALAAYFKSEAEGSKGSEGSKGGMGTKTSERDAVYEVISKLTPEQREALRKYFMEEWSQGSKQNVAASQQGARQPFSQQQQQPQQQQQQATWSKEDIFNRVMTLPLDQKRMIAAWIFAEPMERQRVNVNPEYHQFLNRLSEEDKAELGFYIVGEMDVPEHIKEKVKECTDDERRQLLEYFSRPETRQTVGERIRSKLTGLSRLDQILLLKCLVTPECSGSSSVGREQTYPIREESAQTFPQQEGRQQESMKGDAFDRLVSRVAQFTQSRQTQQSGSSEIDNRAQQIMQQADERASQIMMQAEQQIRQLYQQQQSQRSGTQMRN